MFWNLLLMLLLLIAAVISGLALLFWAYQEAGGFGGDGTVLMHARKLMWRGRPREGDRRRW